MHFTKPRLVFHLQQQGKSAVRLQRSRG
jgi:hypothetical protein